jgi:hypothetical protein
MIAISRHERDRLRHQLTNCMGGIDDLFMLAEQGRGDWLIETRRRYWTAMHLLDDLGWSIEDARETFYVTLPPAEFRRWLESCLAIVEEHLLSHAECFAVAGHIAPPEYALSDEQAAAELRHSRVQADKDLDLCAVCDAVLDRLSEGGDA